MATCKDCVHVDVCCSYLSTAYNKCKLATPDFKLLKNIECDECQHFKDRSRFVELSHAEWVEDEDIYGDVKRSAESEKLISSIESGELNEVSIGCAVSATVCSICGEEIQVCPHKKGHYYNGRLCCGELISPYEAYEWSFVAKPKAAMSEPKSITPEAAIIKLNRIRTNTDERPPEIDMAITAINRQYIKRKPSIQLLDNWCPCCRGVVYENTDDYCPSCGQALDWTN